MHKIHIAHSHTGGYFAFGGTINPDAPQIEGDYVSVLSMVCRHIQSLPYGTPVEIDFGVRHPRHEGCKQVYGGMEDRTAGQSLPVHPNLLS